MIYNTININGVSRPVRCSFAVLYEYETITRRDALADFSIVMREQEVAKLEGREPSVPLVIATDLCFAMLSVGAKTAGKQVDFTAYDIADWIMADMAGVTSLFKMFAESFAKNDTAPEVGEAGKKPTAPQPGTN